MIFITLLVLAGFAGTVWGAVFIAGYWVSGAKKYKRLAQRQTIELNNAQKTIRAIWRDPDNARLEADIYLETYNSKEIDV